LSHGYYSNKQGRYQNISKFVLTKQRYFEFTGCFVYTYFSCG